MSYIRKSWQKTAVFIGGCLLSTASLAVWVDFLDPEEIAKKGRWVGQISECRDAKSGGYDKILRRMKEQLRAASSDQVGSAWKVDESTFGKAWKIFERGLDQGLKEARQMSRSRRAYENQLCSEMYPTVYEIITEKSIPESMMDGSFFK